MAEETPQNSHKGLRYLLRQVGTLNERQGGPHMTEEQLEAIVQLLESGSSAKSPPKETEDSET